MSFTNLDVAKCDLRWQVGSIGIACNIFEATLTQATPHTLSTLDAVTELGAWISAILLPMAPHVVVSCDILDCQVYKKVGSLWNLEAPAPIYFVPVNGGDPLPSGVAGLITAYTYTSKVVGKKYLPGLSELAQTGSLWVGAVIAAMLQSAIVWASPFVGSVDATGTWFPGVWSTKASGFRVFSAALAARDVPAYQRRRKEGVGV